MTGGPDDGAGLYADGEEPCLRCGKSVNVDRDGVLVWHAPPVEVARTGLVLHNWCPGSRRSPMQVPA